jgi:hypothetical protein
MNLTGSYAGSVSQGERFVCPSKRFITRDGRAKSCTQPAEFPWREDYRLSRRSLRKSFQRLFLFVLNLVLVSPLHHYTFHVINFSSPFQLISKLYYCRLRQERAIRSFN